MTQDGLLRTTTRKTNDRARKTRRHARQDLPVRNEPSIAARSLRPRVLFRLHIVPTTNTISRSLAPQLVLGHLGGLAQLVGQIRTNANTVHDVQEGLKIWCV